MPLFVVITRDVDTVSGLGPAVKREFGAEKCREIAFNSWVFSAEGRTTKEISEALYPEMRQDAPTSVTSHIVFRFDAKYGFHDKELWEWMSLMESEQ